MTRQFKLTGENDFGAVPDPSAPFLEDLPANVIQPSQWIDPSEFANFDNPQQMRGSDLPGIEVGVSGSQDASTMTTWQKIMTEIVIIQRLERDTRRSAEDIVRMIEAANTVAELAPLLVADMQEHRNSLLKKLGVPYVS